MLDIQLYTELSLRYCIKKNQLSDCWETGRSQADAENTKENGTKNFLVWQSPGCSRVFNVEEVLAKNFEALVKCHIRVQEVDTLTCLERKYHKRNLSGFLQTSGKYYFFLAPKMYKTLLRGRGMKRLSSRFE